MNENNSNLPILTEDTTKPLSLVLKEIEKKVTENRIKYSDQDKSIKDFRRIFDQDSSKMNQAIFNETSEEEIYQETLRTIAILVEILSLSIKKQP
ncbi:MAG: hypothetical protein A3I11_05265 [Elusimicrobia bacterium RIFCSPLOWO2_02_FULL_39_32]|nr:MAG: hypothetical protein A2034_02060 [Elusimicrobia bacterium GWA2_38_7]OGR80046.1 MAG: hypothetical protein A3B80_00340 [Elusimicrobia bacterium RIFCSPHIGHO2_02_FULL_39_36]OGR91158.1 MAG: hypothetical protein A3I11_05265 [Elusimicrobia bacterium RIFCSPLOWO2_02_FULL_39_32]OGS00126.1 MAG: hypothetical protein A3G85_08230 [Elusimicrobia bacterium RIFCSPLOWO2_12_FULL_39_28]